jgi:hypothetical protein
MRRCGFRDSFHEGLLFRCRVHQCSVSLLLVRLLLVHSFFFMTDGKVHTANRRQTFRFWRSTPRPPPHFANFCSIMCDNNAMYYHRCMPDITTLFFPPSNCRIIWRCPFAAVAPTNFSRWSILWLQTLCTRQ